MWIAFGMTKSKGKCNNKSNSNSGFPTGMTNKERGQGESNTKVNDNSKSQYRGSSLRSE
jgi:hypothetical protein